MLSASDGEKLPIVIPSDVSFFYSSTEALCCATMCNAGFLINKILLAIFGRTRKMIIQLTAEKL